MFTSEPSLILRMERMIAETPIVDPHTHIRCDQPSAPDLASLMSYHVEWSYGKLQVVKKAMAAALARLVESGFYEEDEIPPILKQILHDTPRDLYELGSRT